MHLLPAFFLLLTVLLTACGKSSPDNEYFPLQKGLRWDYQITTVTSHKGTTQTTYSVENLGSINLEGVPVSVRRNSHGTDYYIKQHGDGLYRIAKRIINQHIPIPDKPERKILPADTDNTQSWSASTAAYVLHRVHPYETMVNKDLYIDMSYRIAANNDKIRVAAGTFTNCLRIEGKASISLYTDPKLGYQEVELTTTEWYAPGVGLIKLIREEPLETDVFRGGAVTMELMQFSN